MAFVIWELLSLLFFGLAIRAFCSKKPVPMGFWSNIKMPEIADVRAYNRAMGKLYLSFALILCLLGLPLLAGQNSPYVILTILGTALLAIGAMVVYTVGIEPKYRKK